MAKGIPIGQLLLESGRITDSQLQRALEFQKKAPDKRLGEILIELGYVTEQDTLKAMAQRVNVPFLDVLGYPINKEAAMSVPKIFAQKYVVLPVDYQNDSLLVVSNDPMAFQVFEEISVLTGRSVQVAVAETHDILVCIDKVYSEDIVTDVTRDINAAFEQDSSEDEAALLNERIEGTPVVKMINTLISQAYAKGASDIHIEPSEKLLKVRMRINGDMVIHTTMNMAAHNPILTRVKILGGMNIAEKRIPQDGKSRYQDRDIRVDLRISTLPTIYGEKAVIRLLDSNRKSSLLDITKLGMSPEQLETFQKILKAPNGIILVTGPTGSGKTTTLYAVLSQVVKRKVNIITVEDPVEKVIEGVSQVQVNQKAGLTFSAALRSILRQDPDVIMIGEMRDGETASIGVRAAITGHLVLSTIHTNDCASSITRLVDMGVPGYMVAASISGVIAQRLVKQLCPFCKEEYEPDEKERLLFKEANADPEKLWRPVGCERCNYTGYSDRTAIYEIMKVDGRLNELISDGAVTHGIRAYAREQGTVFLRDSVIQMALEGKTSVEEMEKIIYSVD